jgi:hypothetical protein
VGHGAPGQQIDRQTASWDFPSGRETSRLAWLGRYDVQKPQFPCLADGDGVPCLSASDAYAMMMCNLTIA